MYNRPKKGSLFMLPNEIHFIWLTKEGSRPFNMINMLAVMAAADVQKPDRLFMHCNKRPDNNRHWDRAAEHFEIKWCEPPTEIGGASLDFVQYQSDVLRLQIVQEEGGIYLDTDSLLLRPLGPFMGRPMTLAQESPNSIAMTPIISHPDAAFIDLWLKGIPEALKKGVWAGHAVNLPFELNQIHPGLCDIRPQHEFFPFDLSRNWLFENTPLPDDVYAVHVYETYWAPQLAGLNEAWMKRNLDSLFSRLFRRYL